MSSKQNLILQEISNEPEPDFNANVKSFNSIKLCEIIVCFRYLGTMEDEAIVCMKELAERRNSGDIFPYEDTINNTLSSLPKINLDINKIMKSFKL
jgi:hypothetical protein